MVIYDSQKSQVMVGLPCGGGLEERIRCATGYEFGLKCKKNRNWVKELSEGTFHLQWKFHIGKLIFMAWNDGNELACYRKENSIALASNRKATGTTMNTEIVLHSISVENLRHSCWTLFSGEMQNQGCNLFPSFRFHCLSSIGDINES